MFDKLEDLVARYEEIMRQIAEPDIASDGAKFTELMK